MNNFLNIWKNDDKLLLPIIAINRYVREKDGEPDCNSCYYVSLTEDEQNCIGNDKLHYCNYYKERLFHGSNQREHDSFLYPCKACKEYGFRRFKTLCTVTRYDKVQVKRHKKKRINKKWAKRYGYKVIKTNYSDCLITYSQIHQAYKEIG